MLTFYTYISSENSFLIYFLYYNSIFFLFYIAFRVTFSTFTFLLQFAIFTTFTFTARLATKYLLVFYFFFLYSDFCFAFAFFIIFFQLARRLISYFVRSCVFSAFFSDFKTFIAFMNISLPFFFFTQHYNFLHNFLFVAISLLFSMPYIYTAFILHVYRRIFRNLYLLPEVLRILLIAVVFLLFMRSIREKSAVFSFVYKLNWISFTFLQFIYYYYFLIYI